MKQSTVGSRTTSLCFSASQLSIIKQANQWKMIGKEEEEEKEKEEEYLNEEE